MSKSIARSRSSLYTFNRKPVQTKLFTQIVSTMKYIPFFRQMKKLEDELSLLTSYSSDTIYRLRYDNMTYDYISPAVVKLLGFTPEEMKKINFRSLILETKLIKDSFKKVSSFQELEEARKKGDVGKWQADYLIRAKDGRKIWVTDISHPWFDKTGNVIGSVGSLRDVTARVEAEEKTRLELARMAHSDLLTGLANRSTFFENIEKELKRVKKSNSIFSILLIDVDHFKKINDSYGPLSGDNILKDIAKLIKSCLQESDVAARIGGEEFGVFMPDTSEDSAYWVGERICLEVAKHNFFVENSIMPISCTVSIGIGSTEGNRETEIPELYKNADTRLYIAKHTGRNQVSKDEIVQYH